MILNGRERNSSRSCIPRTSGDDPQDIARVLRISEYSPHERGWSLVIVILVQFVLVFPAQAGMILSSSPLVPFLPRIPRTSEDDPSITHQMDGDNKYSPHKRGWSQYKFWQYLSLFVFPAQAGMIPTGCLFAEHTLRIPRARGDDPISHFHLCKQHLYSPRKRGWSQKNWDLERILRVFPAQEGMILLVDQYVDEGKSIPRASGDDPTFLGRICFSGEYSPHKRGFFIVSDRQNDLILLYSKQEIKLRKYY